MSHIITSMRAAACIALLTSVSQAQATWFVDASATAGGSGTAWATAFDKLDSAMLVAGSGDSVWVAAGTYKPRLRTNATDARSVTFMPASGVKLYGGFNGTETSLANRAGLFQQTILDGDVGLAGDPSDNAYHVLRLEGNGALHVVNGFQVQNGNADAPGGADRTGGGIYSIIGVKRIRNCTFVDNSAYKGGAIRSVLGVVVIEECTFDGNSATLSGGAIYRHGQMYVANATFRNNSASKKGGAIVLTETPTLPNGDPRMNLQNCLFHDNIAEDGGAVFLTDGGVSNTPGKAIWSGCTFAYNFATNAGGAIGTPANFVSTVDNRVYNSILWENRALISAEAQLSGVVGHHTVEYCDVQAGWTGVGNIQVDPLFTNGAQRLLDPAAASPCIDAASNFLVHTDFADLDGDSNFVEETPIDILGKRRFKDDPATPDTGAGAAPIVDMGAYEF